MKALDEQYGYVCMVCMGADLKLGYAQSKLVHRPVRRSCLKAEVFISVPS